MEALTSQELEDLVKTISSTPNNYKELAKVIFSPLEGEPLQPKEALTEKEREALVPLQADIEVVFGKTQLTLKELSAVEVGSLLPLEDLCDDLVTIYANGKEIGRGEVVAIDGRFGVKIVSFTKNSSIR